MLDKTVVLKNTLLFDIDFTPTSLSKKPFCGMKTPQAALDEGIVTGLDEIEVLKRQGKIDSGIKFRLWDGKFVTTGMGIEIGRAHV